MEERQVKIAIATQAGQVSQHFGYSESFTIYEIEQNRIVNKSVVANPGHRPGFLPVYLGNLGVTVMIAGGMGSGAVDLFTARQIDIITGAAGDLDTVVKQWLSHTLTSSGSTCHEHRHHGEC